MRPMEASPRVRDVAIPAGALRALRAALDRDAGPLTTVHALQAAGYRAGTEIFGLLAPRAGDDPGSLVSDDFWPLLSGLLGSRGWGRLEHSQPHPGVGLLTSRDWAEADGEEDASRATCSFSSGMLSGLLTRSSGRPVAVMQVACRGRGDEHCAFAYGSEATLHRLHGLLSRDGDLDTALARL